MTSPSLSFLLTNLNGAKALEATLPHLAATFPPSQFNDDFEVVVVDAGSSDDSLKVLAAFGREHPNLRVLHHPGSRGSGRQFAFENSRGPYVAVLDSDSWVTDCYGEFVRGFLGSPIKDRVSVVAYEDMDGRRANLTCFFAKRSILVEVGGWRDLWGAEDSDLWIRLIRRDHLAFAPIVLARDVEFTQSGVAEPVSRTQREQRYGRGVSFLQRWIRQTKGRFVAYAYTLPEKLRDDWKNQPRVANRFLDLVGSTLARLAYYESHPEVYRLTPAHHNGIELHHHLCANVLLPETFGLENSLAELRVNRVIHELLAAGELPPQFVSLYEDLRSRGRIVETGL